MSFNFSISQQARVFKPIILVIFILISFIFITGNSNAQMRQIHLGVIPENVINKTSFYSPSQGFVAFRDWIGFTTDSGRTFIQKPVTIGNVNFNGYSVNLTFGFGIKGVKAFNQNTILVYGDYGLVPSILRSTDGGNTFLLVYHSQYDPFQLSTGITDMIFPTNGNIGYAVDADRILRTTDQGATWIVVRTDPGSFFTHLEGFADNNVYAFCNDYQHNKLLYTTSGFSWTQIQIQLPGVSNARMSYAYFLNSNAGWLNAYDGNNKYYLFKTTNSGNSWTLLNNPEATPFFTSKMIFTDANTGYAITGQNTISKTLNGGVTWEPLPRDNNFSYLGYNHNDLQCISSSQLWAGGGYGFLELSTNGGGTPLPKAYMRVDTIGVAATNNVNLVNFSRSGYTYKWFLNGAQISTAFNASYTHDIYRTKDTIQLVVTNGGYADTNTRYQFFHPPVVINDFTPTSAGNGYNINITGLNFSGATAVRFGEVAATSFTVVSNTSINASVGNGASGLVRVITPTGQGTKAGFIFLPPPTISSFAPTAATAGSTITITGTNFTNVLSVSIGGIPVVSYNTVSSTTITAVVPSGQPGVVTVITTGGTGSLTGFVSQPTVTSFTPTIGTQGTILTINGTSFTGATAVTIGGTPALSFNVTSSSTIKATVGTGASGVVVVTLPGGNSTLAGFTWIAPPVINSFSPASGPVGTTVTIAGTGFNTTASANTVYFGAVKATITAATSTALTVTVPYGASFAPISVANRNLVAYSAYPFVVTFPNGGSITAGSFSNTVVVNPATGFSPNGITLGDLDNDGKTDMIVPVGASGFNSGLFLYRNSTTGTNITFDSPYHIDSLGGQKAVVEDIDGDGKLDIVVFYFSSIIVLRNTSVSGSLSFTIAHTFDTGSYISEICTSDMDMDGKADIIALLSTAHIFKNLSEPGNFAFATGFNTGQGASRNIVASDMNGDRKPDLLLSGSGILTNNSTPGNFSFSALVNFPGFLNSYIAAGDVDNDGKTDVICNDYYSSQINILRNSGTGGTITLASPVLLASSALPMGVCTSDMDGDGKIDILTGPAENKLSVFKNNSTAGNILFSPRVDYAPGLNNSTHLLACGDMNNDGKNDVVVMLKLFTAGVPIEHITIHINNVKPEPNIVSFTPTSGITGTTVNIAGTNFANVSAVSFGGVPASSFTVNSSTSITAVVASGASGNVSVTNNFGADSMPGFVYGIPPVINSFSPLSGPVGTSVNISGANFNTTPGNNVVYFGEVKAVVTAASSSSLTVTVPFGAYGKKITVITGGLQCQTTNSFITTFPGAGPVITTNSYAPRYSLLEISRGTISDINNDSKLDFIVTTATNIRLFKNTSTSGNFSFQSSLIGNAEGSFPPAVCDLDGDGKPDLAMISGDSAISVQRNTSTAATISFDNPRRFFVSTYGVEPYDIDCADLDGDGKAEMVVPNYDARNIVIFKNTSTPGNIAFNEKISYGLGGYGTRAKLYDLDGDKKIDIIGTSVSTQSFWVFPNTSVPGTVSLGTKMDFGSVSTSTPTAFGDIDRDGKIDVVTYESNTISVYRNISVPGTINFATAISFPNVAGSLGLGLFVSDVDGDGKPDVIGNSTNPDSVFLIKNISTPGNLSLLPRVTLPSNDFTGGCVGADMDNDGRTDLIDFNTGISIWRNIVGGEGPTVQSFTPISGVTGNTITINGNNLNGVTSVSFGNVNASSFSIVSNDRIEAVVGSGATGSIVVKNAAGIQGSLGVFTYSALPAIGAVTPSTALAGETVIITGANFNGVTAVTFGGVPAASFVVHSPDSITAVLGIGAQGLVEVTNPLGTGVFGGFIFSGAPSITSFTPFLGSNGQTISIKGKNFTGAVSVLFGGTPASTFTVLSDTSITATVSNGTTGDVKVITPTGSGSKPGYLHQGNATISSFFPSSASTGTTVTITGTNFTNVNAVSFGGTPAASFVVNSLTQITAVVGAGATGNISISNISGNSNTPGFTYISSTTPFISSFAPAIAGTGTSIIITGLNFSGATAVSFGGTPAASFVVNSPTQITATVGVGTSGIVSVTTAGGVSTLAGFSYAVAPVINSFIPVSAIPGTTITLLGTGFNAVAASNLVRFGTAKATVLLATATKLVVTVPLGATYARISVTNANLTGYTKRAFLPTFVSTGELNAVTFAIKNDSSVSVPLNLTIGDADDDGKVDIALPNPPNISFFRNTATPGTVSFAPRTSQNWANGPKKICYADFNGDGKEDIVTANSSDGNGISFLQNASTLGAISFTAGPVVNAGLGDLDVMPADFDGDGKPDIVIAGFYSQSISICRNTSSLAAISFGPRTLTSSPAAPYSKIAIDDIDGDGKPDVIVGSPSFILVARNTSTLGNITFAMFTFNTYGSVNPSNSSFTTGDIDGDEKPDIVYLGDQASVSVIRNKSVPGNIILEPRIGYFISANSSGLAMGDLDGDKKPEIVVGNTNMNTISVLRNKSMAGNISFDPKISYPTNGQSGFFGIGDVDGDGKPDIAISNKSTNTFTILRNQLGNTSINRICANGGVTLASNITGASYQWQQNSGGSFVNISNGINFSGVNTPNLQISNIPSSWHSYLYRCVVSGNFISTIYKLNTANTWTGTVSTAWENPSNWSCGTVPDANTDVIINSGTVVINSNVTIRSLEINSGVNLSVNTGMTVTILH